MVTLLVRGKCSYSFELPRSPTQQIARLTYSIESDDVRFVHHRNGRDVFVQANFSARSDIDVLNESHGYAEATMQLYKISSPKQPSRKFLPQERLNAHFFISHSFKNARNQTQ